MIHERIFLDPNDDRVYLDSYVIDSWPDLCRERPSHPAMLVIPGGGYRGVCYQREGEPIALAYVAKGYNAFVLHYRVGKEGDVYPKQLIDASRAILYIRRNAEAHFTNPNKVYTVGFSAGGHLAGSLATLHSDPQVLSALSASEGENRPDAVVLSYPVVSALLPTHEGSFVHLSGRAEYSALTEAERLAYSLERNVTAASSPAFIWHTALDTTVPPHGSLALAAAYVDAGVNVTLRLYPYGAHGLALANGVTSNGCAANCQPLAEGWLDDSVAWLASL